MWLECMRALDLVKYGSFNESTISPERMTAVKADLAKLKCEACT